MPNTGMSILIGLFFSLTDQIFFSGGDIFIHAKSDNPSKLFELAQEVQRALPRSAVTGFTDVYSFVYRDGRDLSGFIDGKSKIT